MTYILTEDSLSFGDAEMSLDYTDRDEYISQLLTIEDKPLSAWTREERLAYDCFVKDSR